MTDSTDSKDTSEKKQDSFTPECNSSDRQNLPVYRAMEAGDEGGLRDALKEALGTLDEAVINNVMDVFQRFQSTAPRNTPSIVNDQRTAERKNWPDLLNSPKPLKSGS